MHPPGVDLIEQTLYPRIVPWNKVPASRLPPAARAFPRHPRRLSFCLPCRRRSFALRLDEAPAMPVPEPDAPGSMSVQEPAEVVLDCLDPIARLAEKKQGNRG
jgi:hypothetical protein